MKKVNWDNVLDEYNQIKDDVTITLSGKVFKYALRKARKEIFDDIPKNWLDSLFESYLKRKQHIFDCKDIENMFMSLREKIKEKHLTPNSNKTIKESEKP